MQTVRNHPGKTVFLMVAATLFAKATGMVRQMMMAGIFAAGMEGVAFAAASKLPFAIFDMLFSTAILGSFLPIYRGNLEDNRRASLFSSSFFTFIGIITASISLVGVLFAGPILRVATPNLDAETFLLATKLLRIMFPSMIFAGAAYTLVGIMQSHERFLMPALISAVSNAVILLYLAFSVKIENKETAILLLAFFYFLSWVAQFLFLAVPLFRMHAMPKFHVDFRNSDLRIAEKRALPVMFGAWLIPMATLIANAFSSYIDIGNGVNAEGAAIVVFENAFSVFSIAGGILTYGICNYLFPKLSAKFAKGDEKGFALSTGKGFLISGVITVPIAACVFLLAKEIVAVLYKRGNFNDSLATACTASLAILALALPAYGAIEFLSRACYSSAKVTYPMYAAFMGIGITFISNLIFALTETLTVVTVATAFTLGQWAAAITLYLLFTAKYPLPKGEKRLAKIGFSLFFLLLGIFVMYLMHTFLQKNYPATTTFSNILTILLVFTPGSVVLLGWIILYRKLFYRRKNDTERQVNSHHEKDKR